MVNNSLFKRKYKMHLNKDLNMRGGGGDTAEKLKQRMKDLFNKGKAAQADVDSAVGTVQTDAVKQRTINQ